MATDTEQVLRDWVQTHRPTGQLVTVQLHDRDRYALIEHTDRQIHDLDDVAAAAQAGATVTALRPRGVGRSPFGQVLVSRAILELELANRRVDVDAHPVGALMLDAPDESLPWLRAYNVATTHDREPETPELPSWSAVFRNSAYTGEDLHIIEASATHPELTGRLWIEVPLPYTDPERRRRLDGLICHDCSPGVEVRRYNWVGHRDHRLSIVESKLERKGLLTELVGQTCAGRAHVAYLYDRPLADIGAYAVVKPTSTTFEAVAERLELRVTRSGPSQTVSVPIAGDAGLRRLAKLKAAERRTGRPVTEILGDLIDTLPDPPAS